MVPLRLRHWAFVVLLAGVVVRCLAVHPSRAHQDLFRLVIGDLALNLPYFMVAAMGLFIARTRLAMTRYLLFCVFLTGYGFYIDCRYSIFTLERSLDNLVYLDQPVIVLLTAFGLFVWNWASGQEAR